MADPHDELREYPKGQREYQLRDGGSYEVRRTPGYFEGAEIGGSLSDSIIYWHDGANGATDGDGHRYNRKVTAFIQNEVWSAPKERKHTCTLRSRLKSALLPIVALSSLFHGSAAFATTSPHWACQRSRRAIPARRIDIPAPQSTFLPVTPMSHESTRRQEQTWMARASDDAVYVSSDDDDVSDEAYLPSVPASVSASSVETAPEEDTDEEESTEARAKPRRQGGPNRGRPPRQQQQNARSVRTPQSRRKPVPNRRQQRGGGNAALAAAKALNQELIRSESAQEVLNIFASRGGAKGIAGGGVFNSVNYSTCLHRLARFATAYSTDGPAAQAETRKSILSDPRFAIFVCSMCEALVGVDYTQSSSVELAGPGAEEMAKKVKMRKSQLFTFSSREFSNVAWAVAKLKFAPPASVFPVARLVRQVPGGPPLEKYDAAGTVSLLAKEEIVRDFIATSLKVRAEVLEVARERGSLSDPAKRSQVQNRWIPTLSQLAGKLLDLIALFALDMLDTFNPQEVANLLWAFATAGRADGELFDQLAERLIEVTKVTRASGKGTKPQECSNAVWAFATTGLRGPGQRNLIRQVADCLDEDNGDFAAQFKPQEMSNTAWGIATLLSKRSGDSDSESSQIDGDGMTSFSDEDDAALRTLRWVAKSLHGRVDEFKPQEISNTIWAFATVGFGSIDSQASNPYNDYIFLTSSSSDKDDEDEALVSRTLDIVARNAVHRLNRFRPQELNNLAWGFARLGHWGEAAEVLFHGIGREILKRSKQFTPQDIGTCLWSFATMEYFDEEVYRCAASQLNRRRAKTFKPQECSNAAWALATAGISPMYTDVFDTTLVPTSKRTKPADIVHDPITECFAASANEVMRRPNEFKEQEIKDILWSFSRIEVRHPMLFKAMADHLVGPGDDAAEGGRGLEGFSPQGLGNLAWSYAKQAQLSWSAADGKGASIGSSGRLAVYETSCLDVGETLINKLFLRLGNVSLNGNGGMDRFKSQDLSNTCWSFATLGLLHRAYFNGVAELVTKRLSRYAKKKNEGRNQPLLFKSQEIANLVWGFATLNFRAPEMIDRIADYVVDICSQTKSKKYDEKSIAKLFIRQELANIAWSCAVLEQYPKELMPLLYTGLLGSRDASDILILNRCYGDAGLQYQATMTLFYVQMSIDMEAPHLALSLPEGFPGAWSEQQGSSSGQSSEKEEELSTTSMLKLTSSRMQNEVSHALNRVGFQHVQEHVIGAEDIFAERGIDTSSFPEEFLSIDIANVEEKIGIEVDGPAHFVNVLDDGSDKDGLLQTHAEVTGGAEILSSGNKLGWNFLSNGRRRVNGPTALKHRLLCHLGWCLIHVPFWEWRILQGDHENQGAYCKELLEEVIE